MGSRLVAAWGYGLVYGLGLFLPVVLVMSLAGIAVATFGGFSANSWMVVVGASGLGFVFLGPALMSRYLTRNWSRALPTALMSVVAGVTALVVLYLLSGYFEQAISSNPGAFFAILAAVSAMSAIATIIIRSTAPPAQTWTGLGAGLLIGLGLTLLYALAISPRAFRGDNVFHMIWQVPPIMWLSAIYFSERTDRSRWRSAFPLWALLEVLSLVMPFISFPVLKVLGLTF